MKYPRFVLVCMTIALFAIASAATAGPKWKRCENIPLVWEPTTEIGDLDPVNLTGLTGVSIEVEPLSDAREGDPQRFGENHEDDRVKLATTTDDVPTFVSEHFRNMIGRLGFTTVESDGDVVLSGELRRFFVRETNTYDGEVQILVKVTRDGETVYEALVGGSATRFGRSYKAENYYETLSDSVIDAVHRMVTSEPFRGALAGDG